MRNHEISGLASPAAGGRPGKQPRVHDRAIARRREIDDVTLAKRRSLLTGVAIGAAVAGIPLSWFAVNMATDLSPGNYTVKLAIYWSVIAALYVAGAIRLRRPPGNR